MICPFCHDDIPDGALKCRSCQSTLPSGVGPIPNPRQHHSHRPIWASITSMVLGIVAWVEPVTGDVLTPEERAGFLVLSVLGIVFAGIALNNKHRGQGMAIAGLVLGILVLGFAIGAD